MSVFDFEQTSGETQADEGESSVKSVTALESTNGSGYATIRATIPSDFVDDMDIKGGDVLLMEHKEDSNEITVTKS